MSKKLFIGNLPFKMQNEELKTIFEPYAPLGEVVILVDRFTGRSKGFGFVTINDDAKAEQAIADLNGKDFEGRALTVNEARPMEARPPREGGFRGGGGGFRREGGGFRGGGGGFRRDREF